MGSISDALPLSTLLSQALIAFTIELDNEWERRMPHRTTSFGGTRGPWGTSLRQWSNCMRLVPEDGISVRDLTAAARAAPHLHGMRRWGYITIDAARIIRAKPGGAAAQKVWRPLPEEIEARWRERFGAELVGGLRAALEPVAARVGGGLPDWLTGIYGGYAAAPIGSENHGDRVLPLSALLSMPLHAFALAYERESGASLQFTANVLRLLDRDDGVAVAELPRRSGVANEALQSALGILVKRGFVEAGSGRGRAVRLTGKGAAEVALYAALPAEIEARLAAGGDVRARLEELLSGRAPLWPAIDPPPESWRSQLPRPELLPHHPMPRQGGHPDGT